MACDADCLCLGIDRPNAVQQLRGLSLYCQLLLMVQQRQHLAVLLQFLPQCFYQILN